MWRTGRRTTGTREGPPPWAPLAALLLALLLAGDGWCALISWAPGFPLRSGKTVVLRWNPVPGVAEYKVLRRLGEEEGFRELSSTAVPFYMDGDADPALPVRYRIVPVMAEAGGDAEQQEAQLEAERPLPPPDFVGAIGAPGAVTLRWTSPPGAAYFNLYRSEGKGGREGEPVLLAQPRSGSFADRTLEKGKDYLYRVAAVDRNNRESPLSTPLEGRLKDEAGGAAEPGKVAVLRSLLPAGAFQGDEGGELDGPGDMSIGRGGDLLVLERRGIQFFDGSGVFNRRVRFGRRWGAPGGMTADRDGWLLVPFMGDGVVRKLDDRGKLIRVISCPPPAGGGKLHPNSVAVDDEGGYWILDGKRSLLVRTRGDGKAERVIGRLPGSYDRRNALETDIPGATRVCFNPRDRRLYVVLGPSATVKVFDPATGKLTKSFGGLGRAPGRFLGIGGIAFRKGDGAILVLDHLRQAVQEFSPDHEYRATWAESADPSRGSGSGGRFLSSIALLEGRNRLFLSSSLNDRVFSFDMEQPGGAVPGGAAAAGGGRR